MTALKMFLNKASDKAVTDGLKLTFLTFGMAFLAAFGVYRGAAILVVIAAIAIIASAFGLVVVLYDEVLRVRSIPEKPAKNDGSGNRTTADGSK
jgi:hypothetical protein